MACQFSCGEDVCVHDHPCMCVRTSVYRLDGMRGEGLCAGRLCPSLTAFSLVMTVKKKCSAGLKLSNLMNLGRKKSTSLEPPERSLETSSKTHGDHQGPGLLHCGGACLRRRAQTEKAEDSGTGRRAHKAGVWVRLPCGLFFMLHQVLTCYSVGSLRK